MIKMLKVILWDEEIGRLSWDERRRMAYFTYNPEFVRKGLDVSPLVAPVNISSALMPVWGDDSKIYQRLPAFIADSLPDAWGNQVFELWRQQNHLSNAEINPLDKLSFIGKRGMGAFEFVPAQSREHRAGKIDVSSLANLAERIFNERENARIRPDESVTLHSLLTVGTSAGGRQPKAIIAIHKSSGEVRSGQIAGLDGYDYCLLKFGNSQYCSAELEMTYYELAVAAGIRMMPSELYLVDGDNNFLTRRFDRENGRKLHTQTLAAICPEAESYEQLMAVCRRLDLPEADCQEVFKRMVFNILANNTDDHNKNFSFIMDRNGSWRLSPAYDITYVVDNGGFLPDENHCLYVRAKLHGITREDVMGFARDNGIRRPESIINDVVESLKRFRETAIKNGVRKEWIGRVETALFGNMRAWGIERCESNSSDAVISGGHTFSNIRVEQAYKGNFHLLANVDGRERKFVIRKNKEEYSLIEATGICNLSEEHLLALAEKCFGG